MCAWIELPSGVDSERLRHRAFQSNISIASGRMFSPSSAYANYIRLGWGGLWTERAEAGVRQVGSIAHDLSPAAANRRRSRS
jgi:DNA-binding transcriptional MocR family regulator